jgi:hypothetical protein
LGDIVAGQPSLAEVIRTAIDSRLLDVHTALPGRVKSYDATTQSAEVVPVIRNAAPRDDGGSELEDLPVIPNVPIAWPRGGGYYLHFPIAPGDHVLLVFSEAAIGQWRESGELSEPGDLTRHDLSYPFAIPGVAPDAQAFIDAPESEALIAVGSGGSLRVSAPGKAGDCEFVALTGKLQSALESAADAGLGGAVPNDGGKAAFLAFKGALTALGTAAASTTLKAQG